MTRLDCLLEIRRLGLSPEGYRIGLCQVWRHFTDLREALPETAFETPDGRAALVAKLSARYERYL